MKFFVTGVNGQLGHDIMNELDKRGYEATGSDITPAYAGADDGTSVAGLPYVAMDITDAEMVSEAIRAVNPDAVIHCAAWTAVDAAEDEDKRDMVRKINATGTENIAKACRSLNCKMTYISTDYVFDGKGENPWEPDDKNYAPLNVYGRTKLEGELAVSELLDRFFIVRIAWVFGINGKNFIKTMLNAGKSQLEKSKKGEIEKAELRVVNDQVGTPTYTFDLARLLVDMNETEKYGYYHATNEGGFISWHDFACEIFKQATEKGIYDYSGLSVLPVSTAEYGQSKAARPFNSRLSKKKLAESGFEPLPDWKDAVGRFLEAAG